MMTVRFSKRQVVIFLLLFVVFGAIFAGLYFYWLYPRLQQIEQLTSTVISEKKYWRPLKQKLPDNGTACRKAL
jgi:type IV pilus assembly protein PilO